MFDGHVSFGVLMVLMQRLGHLAPISKKKGIPLFILLRQVSFSHSSGLQRE
jgi:hypothetical protein